MEKNLIELRKQKGFSQRFVAEKLGITRQAFHLKETRRNPVTVCEAMVLSAIYDTDIEKIEKLCRLK